MQLGQLKSGDMFSEAGPGFWSAETLAPFETVYVRTETPLTDEEANTVVYRVELTYKGRKQARPLYDPTLPPGRDY